MYLSFVYKNSINLSLLNVVTLHFTMYILTTLTCLLKMYIIYKGIYNSRVRNPRYKTELRIMTSHTELLTLKFYFLKKIFELLTQCEKNFKI